MIKYHIKFESVNLDDDKIQFIQHFPYIYSTLKHINYLFQQYSYDRT